VVSLIIAIARLSWSTLLLIIPLTLHCFPSGKGICAAHQAETDSQPNPAKSLPYQATPPSFDINLQKARASRNSIAILKYGCSFDLGNPQA